MSLEEIAPYLATTLSLINCNSLPNSKPIEECILLSTLLNLAVIPDSALILGESS